MNACIKQTSYMFSLISGMQFKGILCSEKNIRDRICFDSYSLRIRIRYYSHPYSYPHPGKNMKTNMAEPLSILIRSIFTTTSR